jgi:hypothetical protein
MKNKKQKIEDFLKSLKTQNVDSDDLGEFATIMQHFAVTCKKCDSSNIFVSFEDGVDYGGYTGYSSGQKLFKCKDCGNAASFWS